MPTTAGTTPTSSTNSTTPRRRRLLRVRWAAIGAAVAVTLGAGTIATVDAIQTTGERLTYTATTPCRLIDTRPEPQFNVGPRTTPLGPTETITLDARGTQGNCTPTQLPTDASALALNITVPTASANGFLTIWPDGPRPDSSSLNPAPAQPPTPNAVTTDLSPTGTFNVYNHNGLTHLIVDVVGHYTDHNHDDRYYTETEVDALIAEIRAELAPPIEQTLTLGEGAFHERTTGEDRVAVFGGGGASLGAGVNGMAADLPIADGVTVTAMSARLFDSDPVDDNRVILFCLLPNGNYSIQHEFEPMTDGGWETHESTLSVEIDRESCTAYSIVVFDLSSSSRRVGSVTVTYTMP